MKIANNRKHTTVILRERRANEAQVSRREFAFHTLGGVSALAVANACGGTSAISAQPDTGASATDASLTEDRPTLDVVSVDSGFVDASNTCTVYPRQTEGPYYLTRSSVRQDITEGKPGMPLRLVVEVVDAVGCAVVANIPVDIWHCDAVGVYSGYPGQLGGLNTTGQTFLRGTQITGESGRAEFATIYPGWYPGRTTHIHFKVHRTSTTEATSQIYFPEDVNAQVYLTGVYAARGQKDTPNANDGVVRQSSLPALATITRNGAGEMVATIRVVVAS